MEYIGFETSEQIYGKKNLLYCKIELLNTIKRYRKYQEMRKQNIALKSLLKRTINELHAELRKFEQTLPKTSFDRFEAADISRDKKRRYELDEEIEEIKRKIAELSMQ